MNPSVATELGIMTALRTGDPVRDLALCAAVPLAMDRLRESPHTISSLIESTKERVRDALAGGRKFTYHTVELMEHQGRGGYQPSDASATDHSRLLMRAINLYLEDHVGLDGYSARYGIFEKSDTKALEESLRSEPIIAARQESEIKHLMDSNRELAKLNVSVLPPVGVWVPVEEDIELQYIELEVQPAKDQRVKTTRKSFHFRSRADDGPAKMRGFVDKAFAYYLEIEKRKVNEDTTRYMYIRDTTDSANDDDGGGDDEKNGKSTAPCFKRYALGEDKTFDSVFFEEKTAVLKLLNDFTNRSGKFAIEGFPYKLGLLLHGPPGTGKTSLIKAIAQHTKRHLMSISLSKIETNQELLDAMVDLRFKIRGLDLPVKLRFQDVIFVMEDVDCASSVVQVRTEASEKTREAPASTNEAAAGNPLAMLMAMLEGDAVRPSGSILASQADKLNLAGLLNVLDGVVDSPGRIVIMTTNHPEKLDPALIRPGRVNKKLRLAWMPPQQIQAMLEYYFGVSLTSSQSTRVLALREESRITPAEVEEICAEFEDVEEAVVALEARHQ